MTKQKVWVIRQTWNGDKKEFERDWATLGGKEYVKKYPPKKEPHNVIWISLSGT